jgi:hypothetical protein
VKRVGFALPWDAAAEVELGVVGAELGAVGAGGDDLAKRREGLGRGLHRPQRHHPHRSLLLHLLARFHGRAQASSTVASVRNCDLEGSRGREFQNSSSILSIATRSK